MSGEKEGEREEEGDAVVFGCGWGLAVSYRMCLSGWLAG